MATDRDKSLPALASELWAMVMAYAKQETVVPIKGLVRFIAVGLAGSFALGVGLLLLSLAMLRALQTETTTFSGNWSWAPYAITVVASGAVAVSALRAITSQKRRAARKGTVAR